MSTEAGGRTAPHRSVKDGVATSSPIQSAVKLMGSKQLSESGFTENGVDVSACIQSSTKLMCHSAETLGDDTPEKVDIP